MTSRTIAEDLCSYAAFGVHKWTLPHCLFSTKGAKEEWLRGFFSAEAYVAPDVIKIQTTHIPGMKKVSSLLQELGIENHYYEHKPKNENHSKVGIIHIRGVEPRTRFYNNIGFYHSKKSLALKKSLDL